MTIQLFWLYFKLYFHVSRTHLYICICLLICLIVSLLCQICYIKEKMYYWFSLGYLDYWVGLVGLNCYWSLDKTVIILCYYYLFFFSHLFFTSVIILVCGDHRFYTSGISRWVVHRYWILVLRMLGCLVGTWEACKLRLRGLEVHIIIILSQKLSKGEIINILGHLD